MPTTGSSSSTPAPVSMGSAQERTLVAFLDQIQADDSDSIVAGDGPTRMGITGALLALSLSVVMMRCWARQVILKAFGWDDAAMLLALGLAIAGFASFVGLCRAGGGRRADRLSAAEQGAFKLYSVLIGLCCVTGICLVKISVGFFLRRFLQTRRLRRLVVGLIAFMVVYTAYSVLTFALICTPLATYWDASITTGTCWSARTMKVVGNLNAALNVTTDAFTWLLPLRVIMKLQINRRTKISLVVIMSLGLLSIVASVARVIFGSAWQWSTDLYLWLNIEVTIAILSASLPCLRPIFKSYLGSTADLSSSSYCYPTPGGDGSSSRYGLSRPAISAPSSSSRSRRRRSGYARQQEYPDSTAAADVDIALGPTSQSRRPKNNSSSSSSKGTVDGDAMRAGCQVTITAAAAHRGDRSSAGTTTVTTGGDDGSEDGILPPVGGITKTTEIFVSKA